MLSKEINILVRNQFSREDDAKLFFGDESVKRINEASMDFLTILKDANVFSSKGQARKAGWSREIQEGFNQIRVGKFKHLITMFRPTKDNLPEQRQ